MKALRVTVSYDVARAQGGGSRCGHSTRVHCSRSTLCGTRSPCGTGGVLRVLEGYSRGTHRDTRLQTLDSARQKEPVRYWSEEEHNKFLDGIDKFGARSAAYRFLRAIGRVPLSVNSGPPYWNDVITSTRYCP